MFVTEAVLSAVPGPKPKRLMITASNPFKKPGGSSWALVMRVKDDAPKAAVRLNGMPFPPPPGVVFPSSHSANWAADPREGATIRIKARAQAPANLSRVIGILSLSSPYECEIFQPVEKLQECSRKMTLPIFRYLPPGWAMHCKENRQGLPNTPAPGFSPDSVEPLVVLIGYYPDLRFRPWIPRLVRYQVLDEG